MSYKVTVDTEFVNTEPLLQGKCWVGFLQAAGHICIHQAIHNFVFMVSLFKDTLFTIQGGV